MRVNRIEMAAIDPGDLPGDRPLRITLLGDSGELASCPGEVSIELGEAPQLFESVRVTGVGGGVELASGDGGVEVETTKQACS